MDIRLIFLISLFVLFLAFAFGFTLGVRYGVRVTVKSYLKEENAFDGPVPSAWLEYYAEVRRELGASEENKRARTWTREHNLPYNAETLSLYRNVEYRRSVDGHSTN